ncbi:MAG: hypothetical protein ACRDN9_06865 [Streptosporangiaceae bacterium]
MDLTSPAVSWPELSASLGVPGVKADSADHLARLLKDRDEVGGPPLVEVPTTPFEDQR